jgi:hypothetical protein
MAILPGIKLNISNSSNHIDQIETLAKSRDWLAARLSDDRIKLSVTGDWGDYQVIFDWRWETNSLKLICQGQGGLSGIPADACLQLQSKINQEIDFGQVGVSLADGKMTFAHSLHLFDQDNYFTPAHIEWLTEQVVAICDQYRPAYELIADGQASPDQAIKLVSANQPSYWA